MQFLQTFGKEIFALLVPAVAWALNYFVQAKARLLYAMPHAFTFLVQEPRLDADGNEIAPSQNVSTRSIYLSNGGKATATMVELVFNWKPMCLNVWSPRHYEATEEEDGRYTVSFDSVAPGEQFGIELLSVDKLPDLLTVRCDQCVGRAIAMYPQPVASPWKRRLWSTLAFLGAILTVYLLILLLQFLVVLTPVGR